MGLVLLFYYDSTTAAMTHISICGSSVDICIRWAQQTSKATPAGVTQLAKCKHGYNRPGEPAPRLHTPVAGHPWAPRFDIVRAYPLRPLTGNNTAPAAAPAKRKSLHLDSLKLLASSKSICCAEDVTSLFNFLKFFHREATSSKMRNQAR